MLAAATSSSRPPGVTGDAPPWAPPFERRQEGQDPVVVTHAWKAQHRLYKVFHRLAAKKPKQVAATAVARELIGFIWAALQDIDTAGLSQAPGNPEAAHAA